MIQIVSALACEAQPLITAWRLKHAASSPFRLYQNDRVRLVISGVGSINAASAVSYLHGRFGDTTDAAWLNIGIAGHAEYNLGTSVLAHKIVDTGSGQCWYPTFIGKPSLPTSQVHTVSQPVTAYQPGIVYDMEAAGFYAAVSRVSSSECCHCIKIISDNLAHPLQRLHESEVRELIQTAIPELQPLVDTFDDNARFLQGLAQPPAMLSTFLTKWHCTVTQQHQLRRLLQRWQILYGDPTQAYDACRSCRTAAEVLVVLSQRLKAVTPELTAGVMP